MDVSGNRKKVGNVVKADLTECKKCGKIGIMLPNCEGMHLNCYKMSQSQQKEKKDADRS